VNRRDPQGSCNTRIGNGDWPPLEENLPRIGREDPTTDLDQSGLSCPVLAYEGMYFPLARVEVNV